MKFKSTSSNPWVQIQGLQVQIHSYLLKSTSSNSSVTSSNLQITNSNPRSSRCYTIALKLWDEFNANFALLYFSSYSSIKMWHFFLKNAEKNNNAVQLRLVLTYPFKNFFNTKKHLVWALKKIFHYFSVYSKQS